MNKPTVVMTVPFPGRRYGLALRLLCSSLCALTLAQPAGAALLTEPGVSKEQAAPAEPAVAAKWDESQIRESLRVLETSPLRPVQPCGKTGVVHSRSVLINPEATAISIIEAGAPARLLTLRDGLLPEVHYLSDGRHALLATGSGWILRVDLEQARLVAEVRAGLTLNGAALSAGRAGLPALLAVANTEPHTLVVLDEQLKLVKLLPVADKTSQITSPVAAVLTAKTRNSFIASFTGISELWEISYNPNAPEISVGLVHDFQYREGTFMPGYLNPQRITLPSPSTELLVTEAGNEVVTAHAEADLLHPGASARVLVTNLDARRKVAEFALPGWPALGRSLAWRMDGQDRLAVPNARLGLVSVVDPKRWALLGHLRTDGPVRSLYSASGSPWMWFGADAVPGQAPTVLRVDKRTLEVDEVLADAGEKQVPSNPFAAPAGCKP
ncbi:MAG: cytochrome D1 domain-containing protein [Pseudomonadota bacterium]